MFSNPSLALTCTVYSLLEAPPLIDAPPFFGKIPPWAQNFNLAGSVNPFKTYEKLTNCHYLLTILYQLVPYHDNNVICLHIWDNYACLEVENMNLSQRKVTSYFLFSDVPTSGLAILNYRPLAGLNRSVTD
jgi:hypothetical protein